jgi:hypothetical protein
MDSRVNQLGRAEGIKVYQEWFTEEPSHPEGFDI